MPKKMTTARRKLLDMVLGTWPHGGGYASSGYLMSIGLMAFTGDQWNPDWSWNEDELATLSDRGLGQLWEDCQKGDRFWDKVWEKKPIWK